MPASFECPAPDCEDEFGLESELASHVLDLHGTRCPHPGCIDAFFNDSAMKSHRATVHQTQTKIKIILVRKPCSAPVCKCNEPCWRDVTLTRNEHSAEFHCIARGCTKSSITPSVIGRHIKEAHGPDEFPKVDGAVVHQASVTTKVALVDRPCRKKQCACEPPCSREVTLTKDAVTQMFHCIAPGCDSASISLSTISRHFKNAHVPDDLFITLDGAVVQRERDVQQGNAVQEGDDVGEEHELSGNDDVQLGEEVGEDDEGGKRNNEQVDGGDEDQDMDVDLDESHPSEESNFRCRMRKCKDQFTQQCELDSHILAKHGKPCPHPDCTEAFVDSSGLKAHRANVHQAVSTSKITVVDTPCGKKECECVTPCLRMIALTRDDESKAFHCIAPGCDMSSVTPSVISCHLKSHRHADLFIAVDGTIVQRRRGIQHWNDIVPWNEDVQPGEEGGEENGGETSWDNDRVHVGDEDLNMDVDLAESHLLEENVASATNPAPTYYLEQHNVFQRLGFHVLQPFHALVCLDCGIAVRPGKVLSHAQSRKENHQWPRLKGKDQDEFATALETITRLQNIKFEPTGPVIALPGLRVRNGQYCNVCHYICGNETYMGEHFRTHPGVERLTNTRVCRVQRFFYKNERARGCHWEVEEPKPVANSSASTGVDEFIAKIQRKAQENSSNGPNPMILGPETDRDLSFFLYESKYLDTVGAANTKTLYAKAMKPKEGDEEDKWLVPLVKYVRRYVVEFARGELSEMDTSVRRWLKSKHGSLSNKPFRSHQEKASLIRVADLLTRILCVVLRSMHNADDFKDFVIPLTQAQQEACTPLLTALLEGSKNPGRKRIHPAVLSLFTSSQKEANSHSLYCALTRCILMTTLCEDGTFGRPNAISSTFTSHQYWMRLAAAYEINVQAPQDAERALELYQSHFKRFITEGHPTPFSRNRELIRTVSAIVFGGGGGFGAIVFGSDKKSLTVDGTPLVIERLQLGVVSIVDATEKFFYERVLRGLRFPEFEELLRMMLDFKDKDHHLKDNPRNTKMGYSFLTEAENRFQQYEHTLIKAFTDPANKSAAIDFHTTNADGSILWKAGALAAWFDDDAMMAKMAAVSIHVTVAGVSRAPEVCHMTLSNTRSAERSVYIVNCLLAILVSYVKQQSNGYPVGFVTKYACHRVTYLVVYWLVIARSLARLWGGEVFKEDPVDTYMSHVFVLRGKVMKPRHLGKALSKLTKDHIGTELGIAKYRQVVNAIMLDEGYDLSRLAALDDELDETKDVIKHSFNHSAKMDDLHYAGRRGNGFSRVPHMLCARQEACSRQWHTHVGLGQDLGLVDGQTPYGALLGFQELEKKRFAEYVVGAMKAGHRETTMLAVQDAIEAKLPQLKRAFIASALEVYGSRIVTLNETSSASLTIPNLRHLINLRHALKDPLAIYKNAEQGQIAEVLHQRREHTLAVVPTGGGKSLAALLPSVKVHSGFTLLCVPFRAIYNEYQSRLSQYGIPWTEYPILNYETIYEKRVVLVMMDQFDSPRFLTWLKDASVEGFQLQHIIFDDAWVLFTHRKFQNTFKFIQQADIGNARFGFLTAAWPKLHEHLLWHEFGIKPENAKVIRSRFTVRPELSLRMTQVDKSDQEIKAAVAAIMEGIEPLKSHERGILFCVTADEAMKYARCFDMPFCHSELKAEQMDSALRKWKAGTTRVDGTACSFIVATGDMGIGIDYPGVRIVIHIESPWTLLDYVHQIGRAGRDGRPAVAHMVYSSIPLVPKSFHEVDFGGVAVMRNMLEVTPICRNTPISMFLDDRAVTCSLIQPGQFCDICQSYVDDQLGGSAVSRSSKGKRQSDDNDDEGQEEKLENPVRVTRPSKRTCHSHSGKG